jgi:hypothetical protein
VSSASTLGSASFGRLGVRLGLGEDEAFDIGGLVIPADEGVEVASISGQGVAARCCG